jgi:sensor histidine kinase YesM
MEFHLQDFLWFISFATVFILSLYSLIVAVRTRLKAFYWYFVFSFSLLIYLQFRSVYGNILITDNQFFLNFNHVIYWFIQVIYNCAYAIFFIHLLGVKKHLPKFEKQLKISISSIFVLSAIVALTAVIIADGILFRHYFQYVFSPLISIIGFIILYKIWEIPGKLKIFFFVGGLSYLVLVLFALITSLFDILGDFVTPMSIFYLGVILEQICMGFALGYFIEQLNNRYRDTLRQNLNLKNAHNKDLNLKLQQQSKRLNKMSAINKEQTVALLKSNYESKLNESRLSSLQSKMNPHFIFNALNSIKVYLIENDKRKAITYMNRFSKLLRKILESSRVEHISLREELEISKLYIEIENTRFNDNITFQLDVLVDDKMLNLSLPSLILQPFLENAFWHGLAPSKREKKLSIKVFEINNYIQLEIEDNGVGLTYNSATKLNNKIKKKSMGIQLTKERLEVYNQKYKTAYDFKISSKTLPENGTIVSLFFKEI